MAWQANAVKFSVRSFPRFLMRKVLYCSVTAVLLVPSAWAETQAEATSAKDSSAAQSLKELRASALTPREKVALTEAWVKAHPEARPQTFAPNFQSRLGTVAARLGISRPSDPKGALGWDLRQGLKDTVVQARNSKEVIALTDEFRRLNSSALGETQRRKPTFSEQRARLLQTNVQRPANPDDLIGVIARALRETQAAARTPAEKVALVDQFLRANAEVLSDVTRRTSRPKPLP